MSITILFSDNSLWGCLNFRGYIIDKLIGEKVKVVIVAPNDSFVAVNIPENVIYEPVRLERTGSNPLKDFSYMMALRKMYKKYRPHIIFHYTIKPNIYGTFAAKMMNIPSVAMITGLGYVFSDKGFTHKIAQTLYKRALQYASRVLFLNQDNYQMMTSMGFVSAEKSILLEGGEGIELSKVEITPLNINQQVTFLMIARVLYDKGYCEFVEAAKANPEAKFQLIGAIDSNPNAVPREVVESELSIEYLGFMSKNEVFEYIKKCSCVVLPSHHEGMSVTLMEALAMGKPVVCSDIPGCREMVTEDANGYLVPPKDSKALALACAKFIGLSASQKEEMGFNSRRKAELQFDVQQVWKVYQRIIGEIAVN